MSLMLVYNELVISMGVVFPINSVLNIPSIFVEPNFGMTSKYKNPTNKTCFAKTWYGNIATEYPLRNVVHMASPFVYYSDKLAATLRVYISAGTVRYFSFTLY